MGPVVYKKVSGIGGNNSNNGIPSIVRYSDSSPANRRTVAIPFHSDTPNQIPPA